MDEPSAPEMGAERARVSAFGQLADEFPQAGDRYRWGPLCLGPSVWNGNDGGVLRASEIGTVLRDRDAASQETGP